MSYWPPHLPRTLAQAAMTLPQCLERADPARIAISFFGRDIGYRQLQQEARAFAGWLRHRARLKRGSRVALYMQNCPQWAIAYYGVLLADAVVVPVNPMNRAAELARIVADSGAEVIVCAQELFKNTRGLVRETVVTSYSDYLPANPAFDLPDWITAPASDDSWSSIIAANEVPPPSLAQPGDHALLNYTSGSSGEPKGCRHTHRSILHSTAGLALWHGHTPATVFLGVAPMYQIAGLVNSLNCAIYCGGTLVPMPRWDAALAARLIERYRVTFAGLAGAAVADLMNSPAFGRHDLSSLRRLSSGGSTMPKALWDRIYSTFGLPFIEVYGMTEAGTIAINPIERPKPQCLGVPFFNADVRLLDSGEIVVRGPQLFDGYWNPAHDAAAFVEIEGERFFRTGDIGSFDGEGYLFMTDRLKRMINAAGYKVWPAEVEAVLHGHPDILEACVIGVRDPERGETVKALVVLRPEASGRVDAQAIIEWSRQRMAAYKYPRRVEFVATLPKSPAGKILWRELQEREVIR